MAAPIRIGIISDTHGYLDPTIQDIFANTTHIIHAGDIGPSTILSQLEAIAPVTAVGGNTDSDPSYRETAVVVIAEYKFLVHHIISVGDRSQPINRTIRANHPNLVVFGHTHRRFYGMSEAIPYLNPGYSGHKRRDTERSVATITIQDKALLEPQFISLDQKRGARINNLDSNSNAT